MITIMHVFWNSPAVSLASNDENDQHETGLCGWADRILSEDCRVFSNLTEDDKASLRELAKRIKETAVK
jgi:hypothetical protein